MRAFAPRTLDAPWVRVGALAGAGMAVGAAGAVSPLAAAGVVAGAIVVGGLVLLGARVTGLFLGALAALLLGYALLGRTFAYLGAPPLFVGELVLGLGAVAIVAALGRARLSVPLVLIVAFMAWGALRTIPYLPVHGLDAMRDAVAWLYGLFAVAVGLIAGRRHVMGALRLYERLIPVYLAWVPLAALATLAGGLPTLPWADVPIISYKGGDAGVQLAGIAAFILVGLYGTRGAPVLPVPLIWLLYLVNAGVVAILNRGGMVAAAAAALSLAFMRRAGRLVSLLFLATLIVVVVVGLDPRIQFGSNRPFTVSQVVDNVMSIFGESRGEKGRELEGTKDFRLAWWGTIVEYTVEGPYFWTGKGFGINLADDDGFQVLEDGSLRAPHNGHMEILARMGVPGLVLWIALQVAWVAGLAAAAWRAAARGHPEWTPIMAWLFVYWTAMMINSTFDPYLQGPQGGIWYWAVIGLGVAAMRAANDDAAAGRASDGAASPEPVAIRPGP